MALTQKYGIKYPFTSDNNDNIFMDVNGNYENSIKSKVLHVILTQRGQRIRDPEFGTGLINYIFGVADGNSLSKIKEEITSQLLRYVPQVVFKDLDVYMDENDNHNIVVSVSYTIKGENNDETTTVAVRI